MKTLPICLVLSVLVFGCKKAGPAVQSEAASATPLKVDAGLVTSFDGSSLVKDESWLASTPATLPKQALELGSGGEPVFAAPGAEAGETVLGLEPPPETHRLAGNVPGETQIPVMARQLGGAFSDHLGGAGGLPELALPERPDSPRVLLSPLVDESIVPVFFATDRNFERHLGEWQARRPRGGGTGLELFGDRAGPLQFGVCYVAVPTNHVRGVVERPQWWKGEFKEQIGAHFVVFSFDLMAPGEFGDKVERELARTEGSEVIVFIHGYNVRFNEAALRVAQLKLDLGFRGVACLFSWPSRGDTSLYSADEDAVAAADQDLEQVLNFFAGHPRVRRLHVLAHSMGNRALCEALQLMAARGSGKRLANVVMAAPDVPQSGFRNLYLRNFTNVADRVTLYTSKFDVPLGASKWRHDEPRVGQAGGQLFLAPGIDTIDGSGVLTDVLNHSCYAEARALIADIRAVLVDRLTAGQRVRLGYLEERGGLPGLYWWVKPRVDSTPP